MPFIENKPLNFAGFNSSLHLKTLFRKMKTIQETDKEYFCDIQAPCFQSLSPEETELVKAGKTQVLFRKGDNLTKQGAFASYVLFVVKGLARQYVEGDLNKTYNLKIIRPGEFVGLSAVFNNNVFSYSSVAITDCQAFLIEKEAISHLVQQNGLFAFNIIRNYCTQNAQLFEVIKELLFKQMNGRLAATLLYLDEIRHSAPEVISLLSRREIADFAGISPENTVKLLKTFEKEALIRLQEKDIIMLNREALAEISKRG